MGYLFASCVMPLPPIGQPVTPEARINPVTFSYGGSIFVPVPCSAYAFSRKDLKCARRFFSHSAALNRRLSPQIAQREHSPAFISRRNARNAIFIHIP